MMQSRKTYRISCAGVLRPPLHPAMDRTAGFFRVRKPHLPWTGFLCERRAVELGVVYFGERGRYLSVWIKEEVDMTKRKLALAVALATVGSVWMGAASAAEKTEAMDSYELALSR